MIVVTARLAGALHAALIDAQLATLDEVMMPYMVAGYDGDRAITMYGAFRAKQKALES